MITLFAFGSMWGQPDPSPYVIKTETQLKIAGLPYEKSYSGFPNAPKGKQPYIADEGEIVADSTFIRAHIEKKYGVDFDVGLSDRQRAEAWALERMLEDHLYWALVYFRWAVEENFWKGPGAVFFGDAPKEVRAGARQRVVDVLHGQGLGRHSVEEVAQLGVKSLCALSALIDDGSYVFGNRMSGVDATAFGMVSAALCTHFSSPLREAAEALPNLVAYDARMKKRFFADLAVAA